MRKRKTTYEENKTAHSLEFTDVLIIDVSADCRDDNDVYILLFPGVLEKEPTFSVA